jgi:hypothetical protein
LQERIEATESAISRAGWWKYSPFFQQIYIKNFTGKTDSALKYLRDGSDVLNREEFLTWLISQDNSSAPLFPSKKRFSVHKDSQDSTESAFHPDLSLGHVARDHSPSDDSSHFSSRSRLPKPTRAVEKERPPCLRCKILKRKVRYPISYLASPAKVIQCDSLEQCSLCPLQNDENENDYWKVLGCFRGALRDLSTVFIPCKFYRFRSTASPMLMKISL